MRDVPSRADVNAMMAASGDADGCESLPENVSCRMRTGSSGAAEGRSQAVASDASYSPERERSPRILRILNAAVQSKTEPIQR